MLRVFEFSFWEGLGIVAESLHLLSILPEYLTYKGKKLGASVKYSIYTNCLSFLAFGLLASYCQ